MHKQERAKKAKLADGKISGIDAFSAFLSNDADAKVPRLDHSDIVGAIADGEAARGWNRSFDEIEHLCLLIFTRAACDNRARMVANCRKSVRAEGAAVFDRLLVQDEGEVRMHVCRCMY